MSFFGKILDKLGFARRSEAAAYAVRKRLVSLDDDDPA